MRELAGIAALLAGLWLAAADAGFRTPESLVRNVYAHYGDGAPELSKGLPRDTASARQFFDPSLRKAWSAPRVEPPALLMVWVPACLAEPHNFGNWSEGLETLAIAGAAWILADFLGRARVTAAPSEP